MPCLGTWTPSLDLFWFRFHKRANIALDNMLAWDEELSQEEVLRLFMQKGQV